MSNDVFHFGDYELNGSERILRRGGERVALEPKALDLLLYLAQHRDRAVDKEELQDTIWAGAIVTETSLTRAVMKARRAVGDDSDMQAVIRTVHGHGYQFIARLAGPETPAPLPRGEPTAPSSPLRGWVVAGGLGALAALAVLGLYQLFAGDPSAPPPVDVEKSIAVLPFTNRSAAEENAEFFAAGVHDDVLTLLSKLSDLRVISRTSVQRYQDTELTMREIGTALGVATVVEGTVQRAGNRVRMNVQLINTRTDEHLWAETYDRQLSAGNVFQIQSEIARAIATALQAELSPVEERALARAPTANLAALYAYQRGRQAFDRTTGASLEKAKGYYELALALDPNFAEAYVGLAFTYNYLPTLGAMASDEGYGQARELIDRALELDPDQGEAYTARAIIASRGRLVEETLDAMRQAIALNPNSFLPTSQRGYASVGDLYFETGDLVEGVRWTRRALALGPGEPWLYSRLARLYTDLGDDKTAGEMLGRAISLSPDGALTHYTLALRHLRNGEEGPAREYAQLLRGRLLSQGLQLLRVLDLRHGRIEAARARYEARYPDLFTDAARVDGQNYRAAIDVAGILLRAGQDAAARTLLVGAWEATRGLPVRGQYGKNLADVEILALQGRQVEAIAALRAAVADGWRMRWWLRTELNPNLDGLRDGQAYQSIVQMLHADMAEQRRAIEALAAAGELEPLPETSL
jgi:TolB-like protein/DNA-binding winged helix-turn-helix (wHTH) protein/Tfp pilus assembly protein PilF